MKSNYIIALLFLTCLRFSGYSQELQKFSNPADEYRPWIFWDWMNDLITKKGITSDLEHFKRYGIRGTLIMLIGDESRFSNGGGAYLLWEKHNMPNPVVSQTPEFFSMWKFAAGEASRLGLSMCTQLGPGWCHSAGPWVKPEQSVQHIAYTETEVITGPGKRIKLLLTEGPVNLGMAYHSSPGSQDKPQWVQLTLPENSSIDRVILHPFNNGDILGYGFPVQFMIETADKADFSDCRTFYKTTSDIPAPRTTALVIKGKGHGRYIRLTTLKNYRSSSKQYLLSLAEIEVMEGYRNIASNAEVTASTSLERNEYSAKALTDNCSKTIFADADNSFALEQPGDQYFTADIAVLAYPDKAVIKPGEIIDLTSLFKNGRLDWTVPAGTWKIRRYAMRNALAFNHPAPVGGKGLECDKLDKDAVDAMFEGMVGRYLKDSPQLVGTTIKAFEADSWEVGNPEWSAKFKQEFIQRRGYDPTPWLITYHTSQVVGDAALTRRFLNDMYLTQTDLFAENFFSHLSNKAASLNMDFYTEPYLGPFDPIRMGGRVQVPTGEFWAAGHYQHSVRWAASSAHTYGKTRVATEAFTGRWDDGNWKMDPYGLKREGDLALCNGTNKMILHGTALQPWGTDVKPGMPMFFWGTMFAPGQTWMEPGKVWIDYLSRCQYMLSQGVNVADVVGLMPTLNWLNVMPKGLHKQYNYDLVSEETLLRDMDWKDGYFTLPSGARYRVLFLPETNGAMDANIIRKLTGLVKKGGTVVCQDRPKTAPGLTNYPECDKEVEQLAAELWGACDGKTVFRHELGKGRLIWMNKIWEDVPDIENTYLVKTRGGYSGALTNHWSPEFLELLHSFATPDVEVVKAGGKAMVWGGFDETTTGSRNGEEAIAWTHRRAGDTDIYFVSSQVATDNESELLFRVKDKTPELWDAETGKVYRPAQWSMQGDRIKLTIPFTPMGAVFVVFKPVHAASAGLPVYHAVQKISSEIPVTGNWQVSFPEGYDAPATATLTAGSWTENADPGIKYFSGTASYTTTVSVTKKQLRSTIVLDLGMVRNLAEVLVNNIQAGVLWKPPFKTEITSLLKPGKNTLTVKVTNTWWNRMVGDEQLPEDLKWYSANARGSQLKEIPKWVWTGEQRPSKDRITFTTWKYVKKDSPLVPSGLIGPVKLVFTE
ncbi:hypothetical protein FW774_15075 [Pedobacter sp. BS3]|uniref:glycosyl hydrolase n=1 Tax=Pedobacter sp. BS3 TaxID=2567937 RepID=UPI0011F06113|nr:glycosyl hydrolase [Pedobacter sp. BS3]TZF82808.1 hypothetical protein FW774_15075 [Pedobacter sp. BS3]